MCYLLNVPWGIRMLRLVVFTLLLLAFPGGTYSDEMLPDDRQFYEDISVDKHATFKNWGVGAMTCANYVSAREYPDSPVGPYDATFRQWLMGFATAFNIKDNNTSDLLGRTSVERAMKWIEGYCRKNTGGQFFTAVWEFTKIAYPHRQRPITNIAEK